MINTARSVRTISPTVTRHANGMTPSARRKRVAAYARVSTDEEEQLTSYEAQVDYYTRHIQANSEWTFIAVYADAADIIGLNQKPEANGRRFSPFSLVSAHFKANGGCNCLI